MSVTVKWLPNAAVDTSAVAITEVNFGDIIRPGVATQTFKIGNTGSSIAEQVVVSADGADVEAVGWKSFSTDAATFTSTINVPNIGVNAITGSLSVRTTVPADGTTGTHTCNIKVSYIYA